MAKDTLQSHPNDLHEHEGFLYGIGFASVGNGVWRDVYELSSLGKGHHPGGGKRSPAVVIKDIPEYSAFPRLLLFDMVEGDLKAAHNNEETVVQVKFVLGEVNRMSPEP